MHANSPQRLQEAEWLRIVVRNMYTVTQSQNSASLSFTIQNVLTDDEMKSVTQLWRERNLLQQEFLPSE